MSLCYKLMDGEVVRPSSRLFCRVSEEIDEAKGGAGTEADAMAEMEPELSTSAPPSAAESEQGVQADTSAQDSASSLSTCHTSSSSELDDLKLLHLQQRQSLSLFTRPWATGRYFVLALADQFCAGLACTLRSRAIMGLLIASLGAITAFVLVHRPSAWAIQRLISYFSFTTWWLTLGILSSIGLGTGLQTFLLYLAPHIARHTLKATACGRTDIKTAPFDSAFWGVSDSWSARSCAEFGEPQYQHFPGEHGGFYSVPLLHLVLAVLPEAMLWGAGTAIGELPPFFVARTARLSGERARELDELVDGAREEHEEEGADGEEEEFHRLQKRGTERGAATGALQGPPGGVAEGLLERLFRKVKLWLFSQGRQLGFVTIVVLAAIPNPLFDLAGLTCGHFLVPAWKFFVATLVGKSLLKAPLQALMVAALFNTHSIERLEDALDALAGEQLPLLGGTALAWMTAAVDSAKKRMTEGHSVEPKRFRCLSLSALWGTFVVGMFCAFLCSIMTSTARTYLLHQQQKDLRQLQEQLKARQGALHSEHGHHEVEQPGEEKSWGRSEGRRRVGVLSSLG